MLTDDLLSAGDFLDLLDSEDIACLKSFTAAPNLVQWLRLDIKSKQRYLTCCRSIQAALC